MAETQNNNPEFDANPNQVVYDTPHVVDHEINVLEIYFAEKIEKLKWTAKQEVYTVRSGGRISDVLGRYVANNRRNITANPNHSNALRPGEQITVSWEESETDGFELRRINKINLAKKLYVVANCNGAEGTLKIEIHENKLTETEAIYENPVKFLIGEEEKTVIEFTLAANKTAYEQEITLRPKSDEDLLKLEEKYNARITRKAYLFFKASVTGTDDTVKYPDATQEFINKDGERLEVKNCECGKRFRAMVECTRYGTIYGPVYWGELPLSDFAKWDDLVANNTVTENEKTILIAMSENEGKMDAVQSYDSEILTAGAMQKTINPQGYGELPIQIWEFKQTHPEKYDCYVKNCKWEIVEEVTERKNSAGVVTSTVRRYKATYDGLTGAELKQKIREGFTSSKFRQKVESKPVEPMINLMKDSDFQVKQITDFISRLNSALAKTPTGYSNSISAFTQSNLGKATVLDNDVNRPGQVANCFGEALDTFFAANPRVPKNPTEWGTNFATYESQLLEIYGPLRGTGNYTMTNATKRYNDLKGKL